MFITRPRLEPLGLDLVEVGGGGSCPAQFDGRTAEGRPIYIRYRGGRLTVMCGAIGEEDACVTGEILLDAVIGPPLHGDILLEQVCDLAGLTIRGKRPELSEDVRWDAADQRSILDWSGRTSYWERQVRSTALGAQAFVDQLSRRFPDMRLLKIDWSRNFPKRQYVLRESLAQCEWFAALVFGGSNKSLQGLLEDDHVSERDLAEAFAQTAYVSLLVKRLTRQPESSPPLRENVELWRLPLDEQYTIQLGRPVTFADADIGSVRTRIRTGNIDDRYFIDGFIAAFDSCFAQRVETVDLATGEVRDRTDVWEWYSRDLVGWCHSAPDRYLFGFRDDDDPKRLMAYRPSTVEDGSGETMLVAQVLPTDEPI